MGASVDWFNVAEAARYLAVSEQTIYRLIDSGQLDALRFPLRISRSALEACLVHNQIVPGSLGHLRSQSQEPRPSRPRKDGSPDRRFRSSGDRTS